MSAPCSYSVEYAKSGRSTCKGTKEKIPQGALRIAKVTLSDRGHDEPIQMCAWRAAVFFFWRAGPKRRAFAFSNADPTNGPRRERRHVSRALVSPTRSGETGRPVHFGRNRPRRGSARL